MAVVVAVVETESCSSGSLAYYMLEYFHYYDLFSFFEGLFPYLVQDFLFTTPSLSINAYHCNTVYHTSI